MTAQAARLAARGYKPCTTTATPVPPGAPAWSARLQWSLASGIAIQADHGVNSGELGRAAALTVRRAARVYLCVDCAHIIDKGMPHGSSDFSHYCPCCITGTQPESQFKTGRQPVG